MNEVGVKWTRLHLECLCTVGGGLCRSGFLVESFQLAYLYFHFVKFKGIPGRPS